jgi:mycofactocin precursor
VTINVLDIRHGVPKLRRTSMADSATQLLDPPAVETAPDVVDTQPDEVIAADLLVEEISIDGMCGVY